jgi:hypothetical protein
MGEKKVKVKKLVRWNLLSLIELFGTSFRDRWAGDCC